MEHKPIVPTPVIILDECEACGEIAFDGRRCSECGSLSLDYLYDKIRRDIQGVRHIGDGRFQVAR